MTLNKSLTKSEFRQRADKILRRLSLEVMPFWGDSEAKQRQRLERAAGDPLISAAPICPTTSRTGRRRSTMSWCGCWSSGPMTW